MLNERKLTKAELAKREEIMMDLKKNKRSLVKRYGKDAEKVMYGRATNIAKKQAESMDQERIKEMVKAALMNPVTEKKGKDMDGDGDIDSQDYLAARDAAIKKAKAEKVDEMDLNDPVAMRLRADKAKRAANAGDDGNDKFFDAAKLRALKAKRAEIMRDMEQEAELEGGPIADRYGDMLNVVDAEIAKEKAMMGLEEGFYGSSQLDQIVGNIGYDSLDEFFEDNPGAITAVLEFIDQYFPDAMDGELSSVYENLSEGASTEEKRIAMRAIKSIAKYRNVSNDEARNDLIRAANEIGDLKEDLDLGHTDDEPHMLKADLYRIGKYAMELYSMLEPMDHSNEEFDFPHWWQAKIIKAKDALVSAKHYLDFELKEPSIDMAMGIEPEGSVESNIELDAEETVNEGVWSLGTAEQIVKAIQSLEMLQGMDAASIADSLEEDGKFYYNVIGDDLFHDALDNAERSAAMGDIDRAQNGLADAIGRAEDLLAFVQKREGLKEEEAGEADMVASDIQKAMNKHKKDDAKMHQLQKARTAMNKGDLEKAKKIAARLAEKLKTR